MPRDRDDIVASLKKKGFKEDNSNHKFYIYYKKDGKKSAVKTMVSHGSSYRTIGDNLLNKMAKQVRLTKPNFLQFIDCTLDQEKYEEKAFGNGP